MAPKAEAKAEAKPEPEPQRRLLQVETSVNEEHFALREAAKRQPGKPNELRSRPNPTETELSPVREREAERERESERASET